MIRTWWSARTARERTVVSVGAALVALALLWAMVLNPLTLRRAELERAVPEQRALLAWMESLPTGSGNDTRATQGSLFAVVDRSARSTALAGTLSRIQPEGADTVRVWFDETPFNDLVTWLALLEREHGVRVTAVAVDRTATPGRVSARVTLARP
jgi:general secretion pathway protein M